MDSFVMVRPGDGRRVRLPDNRVLVAETTPPDGIKLERSVYLHRRIACGDLIDIGAEAAAKVEAEARTKADAEAAKAPAEKPARAPAASAETKGA